MVLLLSMAVSLQSSDLVFEQASNINIDLPSGETELPAVSSLISEKEQYRTEADRAPERFPVYISGAVVRAGVYEVQEGAIVGEVLSLAGGFSESPHNESVNLAALLRPNEHIYIPYMGEINAALEVQVHSAGSASAALIRLSDCTEQELLEVPGIGPATAAAILTFRTQNGGRMSREDLQKVPGIKEKKYHQIKDYFAE